MKLLVVGHSFVTAFAQQKYVAMKQVDPTLELCIVTPPVINHMFGQYRQERAAAIEDRELVAVKQWFGSSHMSYVLHPIQLGKVLRRFQPDHIHIEEDPHSLVGVEMALLSRAVAPHATVSYFIWDNLARQPRIPLAWIKKWLTSVSLSVSCGVVCGNREAEHLLRTNKRYRQTTAVLPQLGTSCDSDEESADEDRERTGREDRAPITISYVGRLVPEKGILLLCEALEPLQNLRWNLVVVGGGPLDAVLDDVWKKKLGDRLQRVAPVPHAEVPAVMRRTDILVLPSFWTPRWKEQFGYVLLAAMAAGAAIIGSSSGAIPEVIGDGGLIFEEGNVVELRRLLQRLLTSVEERTLLAARARQRVRAHFSHEAVAQSYLDAFSRFRLTRDALLSAPS